MMNSSDHRNKQPKEQNQQAQTIASGSNSRRNNRRRSSTRSLMNTMRSSSKTKRASVTNSSSPRSVMGIASLNAGLKTLSMKNVMSSIVNPSKLGMQNPAFPLEDTSTQCSEMSSIARTMAQSATTTANNNNHRLADEDTTASSSRSSRSISSKSSSSSSSSSSESEGSQLSFSDFRPQVPVTVQIPPMLEGDGSIADSSGHSIKPRRKTILRKPSMDLMHMAAACDLLSEGGKEGSPRKPPPPPPQEQLDKLHVEPKQRRTSTAAEDQQRPMPTEIHVTRSCSAPDLIHNHAAAVDSEVMSLSGPCHFLSDDNDESDYYFCDTDDQDDQQDETSYCSHDSHDESCDLSFSDLRPQVVVTVPVPAAETEASEPRPLRKPSMDLMQMAEAEGLLEDNDDVDGQQPQGEKAGRPVLQRKTENKQEEEEICADEVEFDTSPSPLELDYNDDDECDKHTSYTDEEDSYDGYDDFSSNYSMDDVETFQASLLFKADVLREQMAQDATILLSNIIPASVSLDALLSAADELQYDFAEEEQDDATESPSVDLSAVEEGHQHGDAVVVSTVPPPLLSPSDKPKAKLSKQRSSGTRTSTKKKSKRSSGSSSQKKKVRSSSHTANNDADKNNAIPSTSSSGRSRRRSSATRPMVVGSSHTTNTTTKPSKGSAHEPKKRKPSSSRSSTTSTGLQGVISDHNQKAHNKTLSMMRTSKTSTRSSTKSCCSVYTTRTEPAIPMKDNSMKDNSMKDNSKKSERSTTVSRHQRNKSPSRSRRRSVSRHEKSSSSSLLKTPPSSRAKTVTAMTTKDGEMDRRQERRPKSSKSRRGMSSSLRVSSTGSRPKKQQPPGGGGEPATPSRQRRHTDPGRKKQQQGAANVETSPTAPTAAATTTSTPPTMDTVQPLQLIVPSTIDRSHHTILSCEHTAFPAHNCGRCE